MTAEALQRLLRSPTLEIVPSKSGDRATRELPPGSRVSVTASASADLATTIELSRRLRRLGHHAVPHIAARMITSRDAAKRLASDLVAGDLTDIFLVGGDAPNPRGPYRQAAELLRDLLDGDHGLVRVGVPSYPDGHPLIPDAELSRAFWEKQRMLSAAGLESWTTTQMCFDGARLTSWLRREREAGLTLPVHIGIAGVVDRTKLLSLGARMGVGASLRYLRKNRRSVRRLLTASSFTPNEILEPFVDDFVDVGVTALHMFTFNQVRQTEAWRVETLAALQPTATFPEVNR